MSAYDQIYKACTDAQRNRFWDAWGIVASPRFIHELRAECVERGIMHFFNTGSLEVVFGLVIIPDASLDDETCYVVDEQLGRTILGR